MPMNRGVGLYMFQLPYDPSSNLCIIGCDEAGYGAWAGPLVVAMVAAPANWVPSVPIGDSKNLTEKARERAFKGLQEDSSIFWQMCVAHPAEIDQKGVYVCLCAMHTDCVHSGTLQVQMMFGGKPSAAFVDGNLKIEGARSIPKADSFIPAVSAASIIAKVTHDRLMVESDKLYPEYGFSKNKGYGGDANHQHTRALQARGPCPIHRRSYEPVARILRERSVDEPLFSWEVDL